VRQCNSSNNVSSTEYLLDIIQVARTVLFH
jgi:hypothetical protein